MRIPPNLYRRFDPAPRLQIVLVFLSTNHGPSLPDCHVMS